MPFRSILVPLEESDILPSVLHTALVFAKRYESYIEGLCIRPTLAGAVAVGFEGGAAALAGCEHGGHRPLRLGLRVLQSSLLRGQRADVSPLHSVHPL